MQGATRQSDLVYPLTGLLGSAGNVGVLRSLFRYGGALSVAQLSTETGLSSPGVRLVLRGLIDRQLVVQIGAGRSQLFELRMQHPFFCLLRDLFEQEKIRWERVLHALRSALSAEKKAVEAAWYYGSVARGEDGPGSDLDVAVAIRGADVEDVLSRLREALRPTEEEFFVTFSLVALAKEDILRLSDGDPWWNDLVRDAKELVGPRPERLAALLKKRSKAA